MLEANVKNTFQVMRIDMKAWLLKTIFFLLQFVVIPVFIVSQGIVLFLLMKFDVPQAMVDLGFSKEMIKIVLIVLSYIPACCISAHYLMILLRIKKKFV